MKKFLGILFALLFLLTFAACDGRADQRKVDEVYDWLQIGVSDNLTNESPRIIMPTEKDGVTITWSIDKPEYISSSGVITQPSHEVGDQVVTIIATITLNKASRTKTFTGTVKALPPVTETPPLLEENFKSYNDGDIEPQTNRWAVVSGKTGTSKFTVVSSIGGVQIPGGSKALKVEAFTERTLETSIRHDYDFLVIEADLMQTADSGGSPINLQSSSSSPVVAFGLDGKKLYYRVDNGQQPGINVELNKWYRARLEIDLVNKTIELFYYQDGQLIAVTPEEKVTFNGTTSFQSFFIRTGSSNTTELKPPAYITNIVINRLEALPRPEEKVKLGEITGIENLNISQGSAFTPATPKVYNYYGSRRELVKDTDYTLEITNPVNTEVPGEYTVVYRFVNKSDSNDVKEVIQTVTVYSEVEPNQIQDVTSTLAMPHDWKTTVTITLVQPAGKLYYYLSKNETETKETVMTGTQVDVTSETVTLEDLSIGENTYLHIVVEHNGYVQTAHELNRITVVEISTPQEFYDMTQLSQANQAGKYFLLKADLDFANFEWQQVGQKFYGILDGDGHVISNLTINSPASVYGGIFREIDGATIKNLVFENVNIISGGERSAVITGQASGSKSTIENITIIDSKVTIGDSTTRSSNMYGGLIIGRVNGEAVVRNVKVEASEVYVIGKYVGGLVGYVESGSLSLYDVDAEIKVTEESDDPQLVGGIVGRTKSGSTLYMERIVAKVDLSGTKNIGGLIGKNESTAFIKDALITGKLTYTASSSGAICGNNAGTLNSENVWVVALTGESESGNLVTVPAEFKIESIDTVSVSSWWITNMPNIANSELWDVEGFAMLKREEVEKFTVTFVAEGVTIDPVQVRSGGKVTLPTPEKEGYEFKGWFTDSDFTTPFNPDTPITEDLTLYALFEEITVPQYKVTFNSNGGSEVAEQTVLEGEKAVKPADPTREGYEFAGWFTDAEFQNPFDFNTAITGDITLYANWTKLAKVTFVANGGIVKFGGEEITFIYVKPGETLPELTATKKFASFAGWFTDDELTQAFDTATQIENDITLYAGWEAEEPVEIDTVEKLLAFLSNPQAKQYVLTKDLDLTGETFNPPVKSFSGIFDGQGHTISNLNINAEAGVYGGLFYQLDDAVVKNLVFENVNVVSADQRAAIIAGQTTGNKSVIENITVIDSKVTIGDSTTYASDMYGGLIVARARIDTDFSNIKVIASEVYVNGKYVGGLLGYAEAKVVMTDIDAEIKVTEKSDSSNAQMVGGIVGRVGSSGELTLRRVVAKVDLTGWKNIGGLLGKNDGKAYVYDALVTGKLQLLEGSTSKDLGAISGNKAFNTTENVWAVAVIGEGTGGNKQSAPAENTLSDISVVSVSSWWITNMPNIANSELWDVEGFAMLKREEVEKFTVTFVAEGVTIDPVQVRSGGKVTLPTPEKEGYEFKGWFTDSDFTTPFNPDTPITEDLTLYALFEEITVPQYKVTFNSNGGSEVAEQTVLEGEKAVKPADPTREGYEFAGWFTDEELKNEFDFDTEITANITLYAKWEPLFKVSLVLNGGIAKLDGKAVTELYVKSGEVLPTLVLEKPLNDFAGWFTDEGLTTAFDLETAISQNLTLYAKWEETEAVIENWNC